MRSTVKVIFVSAIVLAGCGSDTETAATSTGCTSGTNVTETLYTGGPSCVTNIAADAPDWIKDNFHCVTVQVCSDTYVIKTNDLPPHKSAYYGTSSSYFEAMPSGRTKNPNTISSQSLTLTIPKTPTLKTSSLDATAGIDAVGITTYGVVIFNNQAAPGDSLATEYQSMDTWEGHPQNTGKYHYHTEPTRLTSNGSELIGVMIDGYPIYGKKKQDGTYPTLDATTHTVACTTTHFPSGTYCYHVANSTGVGADIIGSYFRGKKGTSN
jgi:hypothetical protein